MLVVLAAIGLAAAVYMTACAFHKTPLFRLFVYGGVFYISSYVIAAGLLLFGGGFTLEAAAFLAALLLIVGAVPFRMLGGKPKIAAHDNRYVIPCVLMVLAGIVSWSHHAQVYNTGQDQGLYQVQAMYYINGDYNEEITLDEMKNLNLRWDIGHYLEEYDAMDGFYQEELAEGDRILRGTLHGLHTYPALLALLGKLFGLGAIPAVSLVAYLLTIGCFWCLCENLRFRVPYTTAATVLYIVSPIVLWNSQNTLVEALIAMFLVAWFAFLAEKKTSPSGLRVVPLIAVSFLHITTLVIVPFMMLIYLQRYMHGRKREDIVEANVLMIAMAIGVEYALTTARHYALNNYRHIFNKTGGLLNEKNFSLIIWIMVGLFLVFSVIVASRGKKSVLLNGYRKLEKDKKCGKIMQGVTIGIVVLILAVFIRHLIKDETAFPQRVKMYIWAYISMTGFITIPAAFTVFVKKGKKLLADQELFMLSIGMIYAILIYCALLWSEIYYHFYYARYLTPFIFLPLALAGFLLHRLPWKMMMPVYAGLAALMIIPSLILYKEQDMTYTDYKTLESLSSFIGPDDAVLIYEQGYGIQKVYTLPIKALTGADVYFLNRDFPNHIVGNIEDIYDDIFELQYSVGADPLNEKDWTVIWETEVELSIYENAGVRLFPYPTEALHLDTQLMLRIRNKETE